MTYRFGRDTRLFKLTGSRSMTGAKTHANAGPGVRFAATFAATPTVPHGHRYHSPLTALFERAKAEHEAKSKKSKSRRSRTKRNRARSRR